MPMMANDPGGGASQTTEPAAGTSTATDVSIREYFEALRGADERFQAERDRRYSEVALEREKALKVKDEAEKAALALAREIQIYKDEKANELREQINSERGIYISREEYVAAHKALEEKLETVVKPLAAYVAAQQGGPRAITTAMLLTAVGGLATILTIIEIVFFVLLK